MSRLESLLLKVIEMKGRELWLAPGQALRVHVGRDWKELPGDGWTANEIKTILTTHLSELDQHDFFANSYWKGRLQLGGRDFNLFLQMSELGMTASLKWTSSDLPTWESWNLPGHLLEVIPRTRGLSFISGPVTSGKSALLSMLSQKLTQLPERPLVHTFSDLGLNAEGGAGISHFSLKSLKSARFGLADIVIIDEPSSESWEEVLNLSESGRHVVCSVQGLDLFSTLKRWNSFLEQKQRQPLVNLQMGLGMRLVKGIETALVPALEVLLVSQKLRDPLVKLNWSVIEEEMKTSGDKTGMRTLNQSLLQLLLRRKIEMRTAFQESQSPDEFDHLLKKVGI